MTSSTPQQTILRPCHSLGSKHWDLTTRGLSSIPGEARMCGEQSDTGTCVLPSTSGFPDNIIPLMLHTNIHSPTTDTTQS